MGGRRVGTGWKRLRPTRANGGDPEDAPLADELAIAVFRAVTAAPTQHPQRAVRAKLEVRRSEERAAALDERFPVAAVGSHEGPIPTGTPHKGGLAQPVVDEEDTPMGRRERRRIAEDDACARTLEERTADRCGRGVRFGTPMGAPRMVPAKVRPWEGHENPVAGGLVVVGAEPMEPGVEGDVPGIAGTPRDDLQIAPIGIAAQHAAFTPPVVLRVVVVLLVVALGEGACGRMVGRTRRSGDAPEIPESLRGDPSRLGQSLGVALAHVELAVWGPIEAVQAVLEVPEIGVEAHVLVGLVVSVEVPDKGQVGRVGHPEVATTPGEALDGVEPGGEDFGLVGLAVAVGVQHPDHAVAGCLGCGIAVLRTHAYAQPAPQVEGHGAGLTDQRFTGEDRDLEARRHRGYRFSVGVGVLKVGGRHRNGGQQQGSGEGFPCRETPPVGSGKMRSGTVHGVDGEEVLEWIRPRPVVSGAQRMATIPKI